jgi:hypothetical protein
VSANYFAELPPEDRDALAEAASRYLPLIPGADPLKPIADKETFWQLIQWQRLDAEVLEAHNAWLTKAKATVERSGREWNRDTFLRYCQLRECE